MIALFAFSLHAANFFLNSHFKRASKLRVEHPEEINFAFVDQTLPLITYTVLSARIGLFILVCLSFKWQKLARFFFACELFINVWEAFLPFANHDLTV